MIVVVMGVTGSGKTTVGRLLATELGWEFADADAFHSPSNIAKMSQGVALTDEDRWPWLDAMRAAIAQWKADRKDVILGCSALKRAYRETLGIGGDVRLVYLKGNYEVVAARLQGRSGHFATQAILADQFSTLEEPSDAIEVDVQASPDEIVRRVRTTLGLA